MTLPARLPDAVRLETVLAGLHAASAGAELVPALARPRRPRPVALGGSAYASEGASTWTTSPRAHSSPTRRALQLDSLSAILPMERRDRLAESILPRKG